MSFFDAAYNSLHEELEQLRRQKSALKLTSDSIDFSTKTGFISNNFVTLDSCECMDFTMRKKPCKHMYRLAEDLGVFKISSKTSDKNIIATDVSKTKYIRDILKNDIRNISTEAQLALQRFTSRPKKKIYEMYTNKFIDELIDAGFLISTNLNLRESIEKLTISEIRKMCENEKPKKGLKKSEVVDFFLENYKLEAEEYFTLHGMDFVYVELSNDILDNLTAIHRFLCALVGAPSERYS